MPIIDIIVRICLFGHCCEPVNDFIVNALYGKRIGVDLTSSPGVLKLAPTLLTVVINIGLFLHNYWHSRNSVAPICMIAILPQVNNRSLEVRGSNVEMPENNHEADFIEDVTNEAGSSPKPEIKVLTTEYICQDNQQIQFPITGILQNPHPTNSLPVSNEARENLQVAQNPGLSLELVLGVSSGQAVGSAMPAPILCQQFSETYLKIVSQFILRIGGVTFIAYSIVFTLYFIILVQDFKWAVYTMLKLECLISSLLAWYWISVDVHIRQSTDSIFLTGLKTMFTCRIWPAKIRAWADKLDAEQNECSNISTNI